MQNKNNHINYLKVENFKCFDSLEVKDIGQFNLIVGDNNSGKTSLLQVLSLNSKIHENLSLLRIFVEKSDTNINKISNKIKEGIKLNTFDNNIFSLFLNDVEKPFKLFLQKNENSNNLEQLLEFPIKNFLDNHLK